MILSFIILVRAIIKFIQAKNKIKTTLTDSEEKRQATKKTIIILMTFKKLKYPINIKEQQLTSVTRKGFVAVEWGGTEIK